MRTLGKALPQCLLVRWGFSEPRQMKTGLQCAIILRILSSQNKWAELPHPTVRVFTSLQSQESGEGSGLQNLELPFSFRTQARGVGGGRGSLQRPLGRQDSEGL